MKQPSVRALQKQVAELKSTNEQLINIHNKHAEDYDQVCKDGKLVAESQQRYEKLCREQAETIKQQINKINSLETERQQFKNDIFELTRQVCSLQGYVDRFHYEERKEYIAANPTISTGTISREMPVGGVQHHEATGVPSRDTVNWQQDVVNKAYYSGRDVTPWYLR